MNTTPGPNTESAAVGELARLLPAPHVPDLAPVRSAQLKTHLLTEAASLHPAPVRRPASVRRPVRRWLLAVPIAATIVAVAVVAGLVLHGVSQDPARRMPTLIAVERADPGGATLLLDRLAATAASTPAVTIRPDQYVYIKSRVAWTTQGNVGSKPGPRILDPIHDREIWLPQAGTLQGLIREDGDTPLTVLETHQQQTNLPTDPDELLRAIYADPDAQGLSSPAAGAFNLIGIILRETLLSPQLSAALYRAAAKIPGIVLVPDSTDAAGRHGIAVARVERGERTEWIFDPDTLTYLGERSYLIQDIDGAEAGTLTATTAVLTRAVVDRPGQTPR